MKSIAGMIVAGVLGALLALSTALAVVSVEHASESKPVKKPLVVYGAR
jgi:hypothetical protein